MGDVGVSDRNVRRAPCRRPRTRRLIWWTPLLALAACGNVSPLPPPCTAQVGFDDGSLAGLESWYTNALTEVQAVSASTALPKPRCGAGMARARARFVSNSADAMNGDLLLSLTEPPTAPGRTFFAHLRLEGPPVPSGLLVKLIVYEPGSGTATLATATPVAGEWLRLSGASDRSKPTRAARLGLRFGFDPRLYENPQNPVEVRWEGQLFVDEIGWSVP